MFEYFYTNYMLLYNCKDVLFVDRNDYNIAINKNTLECGDYF